MKNTKNSVMSHLKSLFHHHRGSCRAIVLRVGIHNKLGRMCTLWICKSATTLPTFFCIKKSLFISKFRHYTSLQL